MLYAAASRGGCSSSHACGRNTILLLLDHTEHKFCLSFLHSCKPANRGHRTEPHCLPGSFKRPLQGVKVCFFLCLASEAPPTLSQTILFVQPNADVLCRLLGKAKHSSKS